MIRSFEDYVEKANAVTSESELFTVYMEAVKRHGLDRALFCVATEHTDINQKPGIGVIHNYPGDWMSYYFENNYDKIDPVMVYGFTQVGCYQWDIIPTRMNLKRKQLQCLDYGREAGLNNGVCTPLRGGQNQLAGMSLASSEKSDSFDGQIDLITAYSNHFYIAWKRFHEKKVQKKTEPETPNMVLTEKERDVLSWVAQGKTDCQIGDLLAMSTSTVDYHMRNILKKLDANNRILAVVKALTYGLIRL